MVRDILYPGEDIYSAFKKYKRPVDLQGWNGDSPVIKDIVTSEKPVTIIEVGTWKGQSAIHMSLALKELDHPHEIICVDNWLGSIEQLLYFRDDLKMNMGCPSIYSTFLSNVLEYECEDSITPFMQDMATAARWFDYHCIEADLIYIDGSHEYEDVQRDLKSYWKLVKPGSIMFGDDFDFSGVKEAVEEFFKDHITEITEFSVRERFWIARKRG